ncbi:MAG: acyclic terpene utilization AtuA family protein [Acidimicrobiia bacterium]
MRPVNIANSSGFYGDRLTAPREMLSGELPVDVLTGDYLAELTMLILWKAQQRDPDAGYARTFLTQMEQVLGTCLDRGIKVVTNAGGLNPRALADRLRELGERLGVRLELAVVEGDDILDRIPELQQAGVPFSHLDSGVALADAGVKPATANAYLGGWGIATALAAGADVVVCGRVTDAALTVGPAAWWHEWARDDWDALAGAVVAGHVIECGPQTTGGNYPFLDELAPGYPGFPIAEVDADGSCVITKQPGTGGAVTVGTVSAQLLYEIDAPRYASPDVVARFDTIRLEQVDRDRVRISDVRGEPPSRTLKVAINYPGGYRNTMTMVLTGLDIERKAAHAETLLFEILGGREQFDAVDVQLIGMDRLRVTVKDRDPGKVGRRFSNAVTELALASYAGFFTTTPPGPESEFGVYWPTLVPVHAVEHTVVLPDGTRVVIDPPPPPVLASAGRALCDSVTPKRFVGTTDRVPLGAVCGARSGDKGGNANVGLWARTDGAYEWLHAYLTVDRFRSLVPEAAALAIERYELPNLRALNFVVKGLLGEGVASSVRYDPQAKGLGEYVRSRLVDVPIGLE